MKLRTLHSWDVSPSTAKQIQIKLRKQTRLVRHEGKITYIAAADASFQNNTARAAVAAFEYPSLELVEVQTAEAKTKFPYVPGLLAFREGPVLIKAFRKIKSEPDVIIFDGQGIAHPQRMGIATHMGILLDKPTIGCAKSKLVGEYQEPKSKRGSSSCLYLDHEIVGAALRTQSGVKPIFVSPGHKIDLTSAIKVILACSKKYRIPEPIRFVHMRCSQK